jgi:hypothetical protein
VIEGFLRWYLDNHNVEYQSGFLVFARYWRVFWCQEMESLFPYMLRRKMTMVSGHSRDKDRTNIGSLYALHSPMSTSLIWEQRLSHQWTSTISSSVLIISWLSAKCDLPQYDVDSSIAHCKKWWLPYLPVLERSFCLPDTWEAPTRWSGKISNSIWWSTRKIQSVRCFSCKLGIG